MSSEGQILTLLESYWRSQTIRRPPTPEVFFHLSLPLFFRSLLGGSRLVIRKLELGYQTAHNRYDTNRSLICTDLLDRSSENEGWVVWSVYEGNKYGKSGVCERGMNENTNGLTELTKATETKQPPCDGSHHKKKTSHCCLTILQWSSHRKKTNSSICNSQRNENMQSEWLRENGTTGPGSSKPD